MAISIQIPHTVRRIFTAPVFFSHSHLYLAKILFFSSLLISPKHTAIGWTIAAFGLFQLPLWAFVAIVKQKENTWSEKIAAAFRPAVKWGPSDPITFEKYQKYISQWKCDMDNQPSQSLYGKFKRKIFN